MPKWLQGVFFGAFSAELAQKGMSRLQGKIGEKISIRRFLKWNLGEGIEKKQDNLAEEVSKMTGKQ